MKRPWTTPDIDSRPIPARAATTRIARTRRSWLRLLGLFAILPFLALFMTDEARGADCGSSYQISSSQATCLKASWENRSIAISWVAENKCSTYGDVTVRVKIDNAADKTHNLTDDTQWEGKQATAPTSGIRVNGISCCIDKSDLCHKNQVEANSSDQINHYNASDNTWTTVSVGTHQERYEYCEDNEDSVYCTNDPEGDAFTAPLLCNGQQCASTHCWSHWTASTADPQCQNDAMSFDDSDIFSPTCTVTADCLDQRGTSYISASGTAAPWDMDEMANCKNGTISTDC